MTNYEKKLFSCAEAVRLFISRGFADVDRNLLAKMVVEGLRKAHDAADSVNGNGKFYGHTLWSKKALQLLGGSPAKKMDDSIRKQLRHEHVIPLIYLVEKILFNMPCDSNVDSIFRKICCFGKVAIITREEDKLLSKKSMPDDWDGKDVFARYKQAGLYDSIVNIDD